MGEWDWNVSELDMSKKKFKEICDQYYETILDETDMNNAFCLVHDLLMAEADAIDRKQPNTYMASRLRLAAYEVILMVSDMSEAFYQVVME